MKSTMEISLTNKSLTIFIGFIIMNKYIQTTWFYYWIWLPIACAIETKSNLYEVYSELWLINSIKLGKYKQYLE
jgi:hypothetical protein